MTSLNPQQKTMLWEVFGVTFLLLTLTRVFYSFIRIDFVQLYLATIVALLFLYAPIFVLWLRGRPIDFLDKNGKEYLNSLVWVVITLLVIFIPYVVAAHGWMIWILKFQKFSPTSLNTWGELLLYHLLMVALPEEFFFRGYFQSSLNQIWPKRWRLFGVSVGPALPLTAVVFAFAHSVITLQWWHFSIFFPALLFGWLREKTGSITAPILWHGFANIFMVWFLRSYI